jgi:hypothetical protein
MWHNRCTNFLADNVVLLKKCDMSFICSSPQVPSAVLSLLHVDRRTGTAVYSIGTVHIPSYQSDKLGGHKCINIIFPLFSCWRWFKWHVLSTRFVREADWIMVLFSSRPNLTFFFCFRRQILTVANLIMYLEQATHNYILHANYVYEFVSYNFNIILNTGTLNACLTKTLSWQGRRHFQNVELKKSVCLRDYL